MSFEQLLANPPALAALACIVGFVVAVNLPLLLVPRGLGKLFGREARTWGKVIRAGADARKRNDDQVDELHRRVEQLDPAPDQTQEP